MATAAKKTAAAKKAAAKASPAKKTPTKKAPAKKAPARKAAAAAPPWERGNPKGSGEHTHLSPQAKAAAKRSAQKAGRPYPNLVDNMRAAAKRAK